MRCSLCHGRKIEIDLSLDEMYCMKCGFVIEEGLGLLPQPKKVPNHYSVVNIIFPNKNLGTSFGTMIKNYNTLKNIHENSNLDSEVRSYKEAYKFIDIISSKMRMQQSEKGSVAILYRKCIRAKLTRGRETCAMVIAVSKIVMTDLGLPSYINEITNEFGVDISRVNAYEKAIMQMITKNNLPKLIWKQINLCLYTVNAGSNAKKTAFSMLNHFLKNNKKRKINLKSVAGAIAYLSIKETAKKIKQVDITKNLGISSRNIRREIARLR